MKDKGFKYVLQIASVYVGTVIGAGFASGQEMIQFFTRFKGLGVVGLIVAGVLYSVIGAIILEIVQQKQFTSYDGLIKDVMGEKLGGLLKWTVVAFLFVCFSAMIAGAGAILKQQLGLSRGVGSTIMVLCCVMTFTTGSKGFVRMNTLLVPILCIGGILLGIYVMSTKTISVLAIQSIKQISDQWFVSTLLYVAYNILAVTVVLASLGHTLKSKKIARWGGIVGGGVLGVLGLAIGGMTLLYYDMIYALEIPMLGVLLNYPKLMQYLYTLVLVLAMYTTAIANGYGVVENIYEATKWQKGWIIAGVCIFGMLGANMGFSTIVAYVFPIFGYIGCFEIIMLMVYYSYMKRECRRK